MTTEEVAEMIHTSYEELAPQFGYRTRHLAWVDVPEDNKRLMIATAGRVLEAMAARPAQAVIE